MNDHSIGGVQISHVALDVHASYGRFTSALEKIAGRFGRDVENDILSNPRLAEGRIKAMEGEQGLMIFWIFDHGAALNIVGMRARAKQYLIGNPLTAIQMSRHDLRAALYARYGYWSMRRAARQWSSMTSPHRCSGSSRTPR